MCSRRVCGCRHGRSRSFAFSGLEGGTCRLPALPTRHLPGHLPGQPPRRRPPGRPVRRPVLRRPVRRRLLRLLERLLRRPPSAGCAWLRYPAAGRLMTARCTAPRARRRARYPGRARAPTRTGEHRQVPSLPVLPSRSARAARPTGRIPSPGRIPSSGSDPVVGADPVVAWSRQFAQVVAEILAGARSPRQLAPWTTERVRDRISLLTQTLTPGQRPRIRRIVTSRPATRVVEMTVVLSFGPRSRALALRLEQLPGRQPAPGLPARPARWLCTEIEVG